MAYNHEYPYNDPNQYNDDWLLNKMKELDAKFDEWTEIVEELAKALTTINSLDARVSALESAITEIDNLKQTLKVVEKQANDNALSIKQLALEISEIENRFIYIKNYIDAVAKELDIKIYVESNKLLDKLAIQKAQLTAQIKALEAYIKEVERKSAANVFNEVIGKRVTLDVNNKEIYQNMRYLGLSEAEFSELGLSEDDLEDYNLTESDFAYNSRKYLKKLFIFSPVSGVKMSTYMAISEVLIYLCNTMSQDEFAALNLSEDDLEALDLTALEWLTYRGE